PLSSKARLPPARATGPWRAGVILGTPPSVKLSQTARWKRGTIPPLHEWPPTGGSHGKPHRTTKILSHARRDGSSVAVRDARAAGRAHAACRRADAVRRGRSGNSAACHGASPRARATRVGRGPQPPDRASLGNHPGRGFDAPIRKRTRRFATRPDPD